MKKIRLFIGLFIVVGIMTLNIIYVNAYDNGSVIDEKNEYSSSNYDNNYTYLWEDMYNVDVNMTFTKGSRKVTTKASVPSSGYDYDVMCKIGTDNSKYDYDRRSASSSAASNLQAAEMLSIFKKMRYTAHYVRFNTTNISANNNDYSDDEWIDSKVKADLSFKGRWIYG